MVGRWARLEPLEPSRHADDLFVAYAEDRDGGLWTYLPFGPFNDFASHLAWLGQLAESSDPLYFAVIEQASKRALGLAAFLRIDCANGSIEVGALTFSPALQKTTVATEAMVLMMTRVFDELGYRRYEWKCNALNEPSRRAALRLGFSYEGTFRQAAVVRGRNRDTAWYSITDREWPDLKSAFGRWLAPENFTDAGRQLLSLSSLTSQAALGESAEDRAAPPG